MITITETAVRELKQAITEHKGESNSAKEVYVRLAVTGGGCSGFKNVLNLEEIETVSSKDNFLEVDGLKVVIDKRSALYVEGSTIDFVNELNQRGFRVTNPNSKGTCGCGQSYSL